MTNMHILTMEKGGVTGMKKAFHWHDRAGKDNKLSPKYLKRIPKTPQANFRLQFMQCRSYQYRKT